MKLTLIAVVLTFAFLSHSAVVAQTLYYETFGSGDQSHSSVWTDYSPGITDASSGNLVLSDSPLGFVTVPAGIPEVQNLSQTSVRTQISFSGDPTENGGVSIITNGDPSVGRNTYYQGGINPTSTSNDLFLGWNEGSTHHAFGSIESGFGFLGGEEIMLQFDVIGNQLSLWAWRPGEPMPSIPQLQYTDVEIMLPPGTPGLLFDGGGSSQTSATYRYFEVAADSIKDSSSFFDDFEDGNLTDRVPALWDTYSPNGTVTVDNGNLVLTPGDGDCCVGPLANFQHDDIAIETIFEFPADGRIFVGVALRDTYNGASDGYWVGAFPSGEIGLGYSLPDDSNVIAKRGVFLPSGAIEAGTDVTFDVQMIGNELTFSAWETELGVDSAATISWTDPNDQFPTGSLVYPFINPNGSFESVQVRSFGAATVPEPSGGLLAMLGLGILACWRKLAAKQRLGFRVSAC